MTRSAFTLMASCTLILLPLAGHADGLQTPLSSSTGTISWSEVQTLSEFEAEKARQLSEQSERTPLSSSTGKVTWSKVQTLSEFHAEQHAKQIKRQ